MHEADISHGPGDEKNLSMHHQNYFSGKMGTRAWTMIFILSLLVKKVDMMIIDARKYLPGN